MLLRIEALNEVYCLDNHQKRYREMVRIMIKKIYSLCLLALFISSCSANSEFDSVELVGNGYEAGSEWCSDFELTQDKVHSFLDNAEELTASQYHNEYDHIGCFVTGTVNYKASSCQFKVWAGATAELECGEKEYLLGCKECEFTGAQ